jgi:hypothetical protein
MAQPHFEVGLVYRKNSRYFLAVTDRQLISFKAGELVVVRPYARYPVVRQVPVQDLCERWEVTSKEIDAATKGFFVPSQEGIKTRVTGGRTPRFKEDDMWRLRRTIRLAS